MADRFWSRRKLLITSTVAVGSVAAASRDFPLVKDVLPVVNLIDTILRIDDEHAATLIHRASTLQIERQGTTIGIGSLCKVNSQFHMFTVSLPEGLTTPGLEETTAIIIPGVFKVNNTNPQKFQAKPQRPGDTVRIFSYAFEDHVAKTLQEETDAGKVKPLIFTQYRPHVNEIVQIADVSGGFNKYQYIANVGPNNLSILEKYVRGETSCGPIVGSPVLKEDKRGNVTNEILGLVTSGTPSEKSRGCFSIVRAYPAFN